MERIFHVFCVCQVKHQEACVLVSPKYGLSQMVKGKVNVVSKFAGYSSYSILKNVTLHI